MLSCARRCMNEHAVRVRDEDFVPVLISYKQRIAAFVMSDLFHHGHKDVVVGNGAALFLFVLLFLRLLLQDEDRGLRPIARLEGIRMEINACDDAMRMRFCTVSCPSGLERSSEVV